MERGCGHGPLPWELGGGRCRGAAEAGMNATPAPAALWGDGHDQARPPSDFAGDEGLAWLWTEW